MGESKTATPCSVLSRDIVISQEFSSIRQLIMLASVVVSLLAGLITLRNVDVQLYSGCYEVTIHLRHCRCNIDRDPSLASSSIVLLL